jgi:hypothetical protein
VAVARTASTALLWPDSETAHKAVLTCKVRLSLPALRFDTENRTGPDLACR